MAGGISKNLLSKKSEYTRCYRNMGGVDFGGDGSNISKGRFAYLKNMYINYRTEGMGVIESVPGFRRVDDFKKRINGIFLQKSAACDYLIIHAGDTVYRKALSDIDTEGAFTELGKIADRESVAFANGVEIYLLDGENYIRISQDGTLTKISDGDNENAYVPTVYYNGESYEARNMLTDLAKESYSLYDMNDLAFETKELLYQIVDKSEYKCSVIGIDESFRGNVYIPKKHKIGDVEYEVVKIASNAFSGNTKITGLKIGEGVREIGNTAFFNCSSIEWITMADSVEKIMASAFTGCTSLTELWLGSKLSYIDLSAFVQCIKLVEFHYPLSEESFKKINDYEALTTLYTPIYDSARNDANIEIPVFSKTKEISELLIDGESYAFNCVYDGEFIKSLEVYAKNAQKIIGKKAIITARLTPYFIDGGNISSRDAIKGCSIAEGFDGRIFLSGNKSYPNTVFYSHYTALGKHDPTYFAIDNYFKDGFGGFPICSMLNAGDSFAVFKSEDDGAGSIFYHTPLRGESDIVSKVYPVSYIHSGFSKIGKAISFYDDPLFLSDGGVFALDKKKISLQRAVVCRSHNVNPKLIFEDKSKIKLTKWQGYLVLAVEDRIYLADSRKTFLHENGSIEYEWFYLEDICSYVDDSDIYLFSSLPLGGCEVYPKTDSEAKEHTVYSSVDEKGNTYYYVTIDGVRYSVYKSRLKKGGQKSYISAIFSDTERLIFGTECGHLCVFNNDKVGVAPDCIRSEEGFDQSEFEAVYKDKLHPEFYTFASHIPTYSLSTAFDDCDIPHLTKSTVKNSLAIKFKSLGPASVCLNAYTNTSGYSELADAPVGYISFASADFSTFSFEELESFTLSFGEREKNWVEKQIALTSSAPYSPFGVYSITYLYTVHGKIKNNK